MRTLLLDGDIVAYQIACRNETSIDWGDDVVQRSTDMEAAKAQIDKQIKSYKKMLGATRIIVCLTDSQNFRKEILPSYKSNRKGVIKPALLTEIRKYLHESQEVFIRPFLEADDVMGILSTKPGNNCIIIARDKDMKTIPGKLWDGEKFTHITDEAAEYFHMYQTLVGDASDGYKGCPGVGPKTAEKILQGWRYEALWPIVVQAYLDAGQTEEDALRNARLARILRWQDWDSDFKIPILWTPKT